MGLASGLSGGVLHQLTPLPSKNVRAVDDVCFGSLSCMNLWPPGISNMQMSVGPFQLILAQTWTFTGFLGRGFRQAGSPALRQQYHLWDCS